MGDSHAWLAVDGNTSTFWDGSSNTLNPCVDIQLDHPVLLDSLTVTTRINASKYYKYEVYGSLDRKTWEKIGEKTSTAASTESGDTYTFDGDRLVSWIRLKGVESNVNNSFHIAEISATGSHAFLDLKERMETIDAILQEEEEKNVLPSSLKEQLETLSDSWQNVQLTVDTTDEQIEALIEQADSLIETVRSLPDMSLLKCALNKTHTLQLNEFAEGKTKRIF
ncbi:discoidin domain-containing protein [Allobaculum sp. Allo2]|uniref:discoidin domain-containing protein n=1 Tax=Allobaculum sp. Allo2 TaxID=2853432 RepID=UPI001F609264|nr:discoidin domain-containing protein [Allobaculum sp. Allo2]UNT92831.1 discoidin domain-containing protein [Allobaculum sp. Allo2]